MKYSTFERIFKERAWINKWYKAIPIWIIINITCFLIIIALKGFESRMSRYNKYPSDKYRKVVKEGLFWDTTEYHER